MIYCLGSVNLDQIGRVAHLPAVGETVLGRSFSIAPGGKGANQSLAARRAGSHVVHIGCVGNDTFSAAALKLLREENVELGRIERIDGATGIAMILVGDRGENVIGVFPGANGALTPDIATRHLADLSADDVLLVQQEVPDESVKAALQLARRVGARSVLNIAPVSPASPELAPLASVLIANEMEFQQLVGDSVTAGDAARMAPALGAWATRHGQIVIVTLGPDGALVADGRGAPYHVPAISIDSVDTVGAGDTFCGYFAAELERGADIRAAVECASIAAGLACTRSGAQPSIPYRREVTQHEAIWDAAK